MSTCREITELEDTITDLEARLESLERQLEAASTQGRGGARDHTDIGGHIRQLQQSRQLLEDRIRRAEYLLQAAMD